MYGIVNRTRPARVARPFAHAFGSWIEWMLILSIRCVHTKMVNYFCPGGGGKLMTRTLTLHADQRTTVVRAAVDGVKWSGESLFWLHSKRSRALFCTLRAFGPIWLLYDFSSRSFFTSIFVHVSLWQMYDLLLKNSCWKFSLFLCIGSLCRYGFFLFPFDIQFHSTENLTVIYRKANLCVDFLLAKRRLQQTFTGGFQFNRIYTSQLRNSDL